MAKEEAGGGPLERKPDPGERGLSKGEVKNGRGSPHNIPSLWDIEAIRISYADHELHTVHSSGTYNPRKILRHPGGGRKIGGAV